MKTKSLLLVFLLLSFVSAYAGTDKNTFTWAFGEFMYGEFDSKGETIESSVMKIYPKDDRGRYIIEIVFASNYQTATYPMEIYLSEYNGIGNLVSKQKIGAVWRKVKSSVSFGEDVVNIFVEGYQLSVKADKLLLYTMEGAEYKGCLIFKTGWSTQYLAEENYEELVKKIKRIKWM